MLIIAIDGPSASGKSVVGCLVAKAIGWEHFSTGFVYRSYAYCLNLVAPHLLSQDLPESLNDDEEKILEDTADHFFDNISFGNEKVFIKNGTDITDALKTADISLQASLVAKHPFVRQLLLALQRKYVSQMNSIGVVVDGRDIGTVVFPHAGLKIFLTASSEERARRRFKEAQTLGQSLTYENVLNDIEARDHKDMSRLSAPLQAAGDSTCIDSTELSLQQVVDKIVFLASEEKLI
jgi:cytidylate kinase